ncbi:MAG: hypothetical protein IT308_04620 [Anaerolineaceae bacterium]|nr:hypothetical protein [Anaerolineaceae bacterium]
MEIPRHWRLQKQRYALLGETCTTCQKKIFPPRPVCPHCGGALQVSAGLHAAPALAELTLAPVRESIPIIR